MDLQRKPKLNLNGVTSSDLYPNSNSSYDFDAGDKQHLIKKKRIKSTRFASKYWRWVALLWFWMFTIGAYYSYYTQFTLYYTIRKKIINDSGDGTSFKHDMIYVSYSVWGFLFSLLAGLSIVKFGLKKSIIVFASIVIVSQALFTAAGFISEDIGKESNNQLPYILSIIGNWIFGIGREGIDVWLFTIIHSIFFKKSNTL